MTSDVADLSPGAKVLLAIEAVVADNGKEYRPIRPVGRPSSMMWLSKDNAVIRSVEPVPMELPTGLGAVIEAKCPQHESRTRLVRIRPPGNWASWISTNDTPAWVSDFDLSEVVVLRDGWDQNGGVT